MILRQSLILLASASVAIGLANCTDDDAPPPAGSVDSGKLDAAFDATKPTDGAVADVATVDAPTEAAPPDAGTDADLDASADADADSGPTFDDAGCPNGAGTVVDPTTAGVPSTGLVLWLRADIGVATLDGGAVCRWDDVSGNGNAFRPSASGMPFREAAAFDGGAPAVRFTANTTYLVRSDLLGIAATAGRTVAVYGATQDTTKRFQYFHQGKGGTPGTYFGLDQNTYNTAGSREGVYVTNNSYDSDLATSTNPRKHVLSISNFTAGTALPGALSYSVDGNVRTLTRNSGGLGNGTVEDFAQADFTTVGTAVAGFGTARIGEVLVWNRALTTLERTAIETYFGTRFP